MASGDVGQRDLVTLVVDSLGAVVETDVIWEPYRLVDPGGGMVASVAQFLQELQAGGCSPSTQRSYALDLLRWFRFLRAVEVLWGQATRCEARDFCRWLALADKPRRGSAPRLPAGVSNAVTGKRSPGRKYATSTLAHSETVLRSFYAFHCEAGSGPIMNPFPLVRERAGSRAHAHHNPMEAFAKERSGRYRPRVAARVPRRIPDERFNQVFAQLRSDRDRALVAFWVSTGARAAELLGVRGGVLRAPVARRGSQQPVPAMLVHLYAAILAQTTNLGPVAMARSSGLSYDQVAHATAWYLRHETLTAAINDVVNHHHHLPATRLWGDGTFASSDGQRFPVQVKAANAGALPRYFGFGRGLSVLTSVTDHYATFGTKVIPASAREGLFALDEIFALRDRDSELAIAGHTTDTAGFTDLLFGVYNVVGLGFWPRIRDLADQRLWRLDDTALPDLVEPLMVNRVNVELIAAHWDDLLRLGASIHEGAVLPSLLLTKLQAFPRQNALARALQEHGRLVKTLFILRYLQRPEMRRRVESRLNKGENLNGLRETVNFAHGGAIRHRQLTDQVAQALCLTLVVNCIAAFNAGLLPPAVEALRAAGFEVDDADVAHVGPTVTEHISVHGRYYYDLDRPPKGLRRVMWVDLRYGEADAEQRMRCDGGCSAGQQAPEGMGAVPGQLHQVGDLAKCGLDAVAPLGDDRQQDGRHGGPLVLGGRDEQGGAAGGQPGGEGPAVEALVRQQVAGPGPGFEQVFGDLAFIDRGGHDAPGADDPAAQVRLDGQPEAVEPFGVRGVAAEPGGQVVARTGPAVRAADPGAVLDRQRGGVDLLAVIFGQPGRQHRPQLLERAPQPADPPVRLALVRQPREQVSPVPGHLGQEPGLAAPAQQVPHQRDGQQLGVAAGRRRARPGRNRDGPAADRVIDQHVHVDEQILGWQHGGWPLRTRDFDNLLSLAEATSRQGDAGISTHITRLRQAPARRLEPQPRPSTASRRPARAQRD